MLAASPDVHVYFADETAVMAHPTMVTLATAVAIHMLDAPM